MHRLLIAACTLLLACFTSPITKAQAPTGLASIGTCSGSPCLLRDNHGPWKPLGPTTDARRAPPAYLIGPTPWADKNYGSGMLSAIHALSSNFDTLRFFTSQAALSPNTPYYTPSYLPSFVAAVELARNAGFTVIISMTWEPGSILQPSMPNSDTIAAWQQLAPQFANDHGVIFEIFNEPVPLNDMNCGQTGSGPYTLTHADFASWQTGMNSVLSAIRGVGANNVAFADGLCYGKNVRIAYPLMDPAHNFGLAVHMYYNTSFNTIAEFNEDFFTPCKAMGVVCEATEFNVSSGGHNCAMQPGQLPGFLQSTFTYLEEKGSGLSWYSFDDPDTMMVALNESYPNHGVSGTTLTNLNTWKNCNTSPTPWGGGQMFVNEVSAGHWH